MVKLFSILGFGSMSVFERCFTRNERMLNEGNISIGKRMIHNSLLHEMSQTIKHKLHEENDIELVNNIMNKFFIE